MPGADARTGLSEAQRRALAATRFTVRWVGSTGSTNEDLRIAAAQGAPEGTVLVADHQTAGRGRRGRTWDAPPGSSLLLSVLLRPDLDPEHLHLLTTAVGVAAAEAVDEELAVPVGLKWPNDLVVETDAGERKLGGILAETTWSGDRPDAVIVGLGLNVAWPDPVPAPLAGIATALDHLTTEAVDRGDLLVALLLRLEAVLADPAGSALIERWHHLATTVGRAVRVELASGRVVVGTATGLADDGRLVVETDDGPEAITAGDVHHLRPA